MVIQAQLDTDHGHAASAGGEVIDPQPRDDVHPGGQVIVMAFSHFPQSLVKLQPRGLVRATLMLA